MNKNNYYPYMTDVMRELYRRASNRGLEIAVESSTGIVMTIKNNATVRVVMGADLGLNFSAAGRLCNDKYFAADLLKQAGLNVIESKIIHSDTPLSLDEVQFPCIVKPNKGAGGDGLSLVNSLGELNAAIEIAQKFDSQILIQERCTLREFRVIVLDGLLLYAYEKQAWRIRGDGESSIADIVSNYNAQVTTRYKISLNDTALNTGLLNAGRKLSTVLLPGESYELFANANLKKGAESFPVEYFAPEYIDVVVRACSAMGLRYGGVDLFASRPEVFDKDYCVVEVNSNPGFQFLKKDAKLMGRVLDKVAIALFDN